MVQDALPQHKLRKPTKCKNIRKIDAEEAYEILKTKKPKPKSLYKVRGVINLYDENYLLSLNWAFYKSLIMKTKHANIIKKYKIEQRLHEYDMLKELSTYALNKGPELKGFHLLVGIDQLYGYNYAPDEKSIYEKVTDWVSKKFVPMYTGSEQEFKKRFARAVNNVLTVGKDTLEVPFTKEEFCSQIGLTGTSGSAYDYEKGGLEVGYGAHELKFSKNKYAKSAALSTENKVARLTSIKEPKAKVSIKVELFPKIRLIVSADYNMTLKMRYVDTWLQKWMGGSELSTLWMSDEDRIKMWTDFCKQGDWNVPIDQSGFDHHVSKDMVMIMLSSILDLIKKRAIGTAKGELIEVMESILDNMPNTTVQVDNKFVPGKTSGTTNVNWENGVLSGWQWTAFLDTLANIAEKIMAQEYLQEQGLPINFLMFNAQGDDQLTKFKYLYEGILYWAALSSMGFEIHVTKNFFSNKHNEYLRKYSTKEGMNGYPSRMVNSILWQYPGQAFERNKLSRMSGLKDKWLKISERLRISFAAVRNLFTRDAVKSGIDMKLVEIYLSMKKVNGGAELVAPYNNMKIVDEGGKLKKGIDVVGTGYRNFEAKFGAGQARELKNWLLGTLNIQDSEIRGEEEIQVKKAPKMTNMKMTLDRDVKLTKPKIIRGVSPVTVVGDSDEVIDKYYPDARLYFEHTRAPRSWIKEWILGKVKVTAPILNGCSDETASMLIKPYVNSLYMSMLKKEMKGNENRWQSILVAADFAFKQMDVRVPTMFY